MSGHSERTRYDVPNATQEDRDKYIKAWEEMMITIWREKIIRLRVIDTTQLYKDIHGSVLGSGAVQSIMHRFLEYGIYQDCGVGRGYKKGNGGNLEFLDPSNQTARSGNHTQKSGKQTKYGNHRKSREWFSRSYFASVMVLKEQMAYMYGQEFVGILTDAISNAETSRSTSMRSYLYGHHGKKR